MREHTKMATTLEAPKMLGNRTMAEKFFSVLPEDLSGKEITVKFHDRTGSTPSFIDEMIQIVLTERRASKLILENAGDMVCRLAHHSAEYFKVSDQLICNP